LGRLAGLDSTPISPPDCAKIAGNSRKLVLLRGTGAPLSARRKKRVEHFLLAEAVERSNFTKILDRAYPLIVRRISIGKFDAQALYLHV
jgi:hypothetical protein